MNRSSRTHGRRAFTLVETMLAALLGGMVVMATMGLFGAMRDADKRTESRAYTTSSLTTLHRTCARALRSLVVAARTAPAPAVVRSRVNTPAAAPDDENTADKRPRVILEPDTVTGMQRLEVVVSEPPIFSRAAGSSTAYGATRGAFEFAPEASGDKYRLEWVSFEPGLSADQPGPVRSRITLAYGISKAQWRFMKTSEGGRLEPRTSFVINDITNIPAYAELDVTMADGRTVRWMFELQWSLAGEPGVVLAAADRLYGPNNRPASASSSNRPGAGGSESRSSGGADRGRGENGRTVRKPDERQVDVDRAASESYLLSVERFQREGIDTPRKPR